MSKKKNRIILLVVGIIVVLFFVFFIMKINGMFDYTRNYDIKEITSSRDQDFVQALIDNEEETVWGDPIIWEEPLANPGDYIDIEFNNTRDISSIEMIGEIPDDIHLYYEYNGTFAEIKYIKNYDMYYFENTINTKMIKIQVGNNATNYNWVIKELRINE